MQTEKLLELLQKFTEGNLTVEENNLLQDLINSANRETQENVLQQYEQIVLTAKTNNSDPVLLKKIKAAIEELKSKEMDEVETGKLRQMFSWRKVAVAASVIILIGLGSYFLFFNRMEKPDEVVNVDLPKDVEAPKGTKAVITLADGRVVTLDSVNAGTVAMQGNVNVTKTADGKIIYSGSSSEVVYNTLSNPRGSKVIDMTLADGSRVWLNAGSSVRYPIAFVGNERKVSITGEAYFEVTHNTSMPFKVSNGEMEVTVLGTHFNVNAYEDENNIKVTLLEGLVKVNKGNASGFVKPGQQAILRQAQDDKEIKFASDVDLEAVMAWKNGYFNFNKASLEEVMRQLTRWYDVEVEYEGKIEPREFVGEMERSLTLSQVLRILEKNNVHFEIKGKKIIVRP